MPKYAVNTSKLSGKVGYELNKEERGKDKLSAKRWKMSYDVGECKFIHK